MSFMTGVGARSLARSELLKSKAATSARLITERPCVQIAAGPSTHWGYSYSPGNESYFYHYENKFINDINFAFNK